MTGFSFPLAFFHTYSFPLTMDFTFIGLRDLSLWTSQILLLKVFPRGSFNCVPQRECSVVSLGLPKRVRRKPACSTPNQRGSIFFLFYTGFYSTFLRESHLKLKSKTQSQVQVLRLTNKTLPDLIPIQPSKFWSHHNLHHMLFFAVTHKSHAVIPPGPWSCFSKACFPFPSG